MFVGYQVCVVKLFYVLEGGRREVEGGDGSRSVRIFPVLVGVASPCSHPAVRLSFCFSVVVFFFPFLRFLFVCSTPMTCLLPLPLSVASVLNLGYILTIMHVPGVD